MAELCFYKDFCKCHVVIHAKCEAAEEPMHTLSKYEEIIVQTCTSSKVIGWPLILGTVLAEWFKPMALGG